jgi:DNA-binding GntR family transcriptional regulator
MVLAPAKTSAARGAALNGNARSDNRHAAGNGTAPDGTAPDGTAPDGTAPDPTVPGGMLDRALHCDRGQRRQAIVESLLAEVFQGRLRAGEHLVTQDLADRFGVSHTPIREALIALAGIGIVDLLPNRGAVVRHVTAKEVREICQVRRVLECEATRLACGRLDLAALHTLADELRRLTTVRRRLGSGFIAKARVLDSRLHDLIAESCGNAFLAKEIGRLKLLFRSFRDVAWEWNKANKDFHRFAEEAREHLAIVEALLAGDAKEAARAMARHIRSGLKYWSRALAA